MDRRSVVTALLALAVAGCANVTPSLSMRPADTPAVSPIATPRPSISGEPSATPASSPTTGSAWRDIVWHRVSDPALSQTKDTAVRGVAMAAETLVLSGSYRGPLPEGRIIGRVWVSDADGGWIHHELRDVDGGKFYAVDLATRDGDAVVIGENKHGRRLLRSTDLEQWIPIDDVPSGAVPRAIDAGPEGYVVAMSDGSLRVSHDTMTWGRIVPLRMPEITWWNALERTPAGWFLTGRRATDDRWFPLILRSTDRKVWTRVGARDPVLEAKPFVDLGRVLAFDGTLLAVGTQRSIPCDDSALFFDGCGTERAAWRSVDDGASWQRIALLGSTDPVPGNVPTWEDRAAVGGDGLVTWEAGEILTSADGETWRRIGRAPGDPWPNNPGPVAGGLFVDDGHLVSIDPRLEVWIGDPIIG